MVALYKTVMVGVSLFFVSYWVYCIATGKMLGK